MPRSEAYLSAIAAYLSGDTRCRIRADRPSISKGTEPGARLVRLKETGVQKKLDREEGQAMGYNFLLIQKGPSRAIRTSWLRVRTPVF